MKIELKNVQFSERMSEETNSFVADIYVDGKKCGYCKNSGQGGCTEYHSYPENRDLFNKTEKWLLNQPDINIGSVTDPYMVTCNMESKVDQLFENWLNKKSEDRRKKKMLNHIMWGVPNGSSYTYVKLPKPIKDIPHIVLQSYLNKLKGDFKEGQVFLNTNLGGFDL